jgi:hypothetical protein
MSWAVVSMGLLAALYGTGGQAAVVVFQGDLAGFDLAAGSPPISITFDGIAPGTNVAGTTIGGVTFTSPAGNSLDVVTAASTSTPGGFAPPGGDTDNVLPATSGANVLSPGGSSLVPGPATAEVDGLQLLFDTGLSAFGIDILFQSLDGFALVDFAVFDTSLALISSGSLNIPSAGNGPDPTSNAAAGGAFFIGFVSDAPDIGLIVFSEGDSNDVNPDSNIGYDSLRFSRVAAVPEPASIVILGFALAGLGLARRRLGGTTDGV